ncbi:MAG: FeoA family protein [Bacteroidota bacterium]
MEATLAPRPDHAFSAIPATPPASGQGAGDLPLCLLRAGESGIVRRLEGGEEFRSRMLSLGLAPGRLVTVCRSGCNQPFVLRIDAGRIMVDWRTLGRIHVQPWVVPAREGGHGHCRRGGRGRWRRGSRI